MLSGDKHICLAISEPGAGSDVAGITTRGVKSADGKVSFTLGRWACEGKCRDGKGRRLTCSLLLRFDAVLPSLVPCYQWSQEVDNVSLI